MNIIYNDKRGMFGSQRSRMVMGVKNYNYEQIMDEIVKGKKFVMYPFSIFLFFFVLSDTTLVYFVEEVRHHKYWFLCLIVTILPLIFLVVVFTQIAPSIFDKIDIGTIMICIYFFAGIISQLSALITLIYAGGIDVTDEVVVNIINLEEQRKQNEKKASEQMESV